MSYIALLTGFSLCALAQQNPAPKKLDPQAVEFFETKVRPVLANNCFSCHGAADQKGGIRLDARDFVLKGNGHGSAVVPGQPDASLIVKAINYNGQIKMPPTGKLTPHEIDALTAWVKMGAPWPADKASEAAVRAAQTGEYLITDAQRKHWAFLPVKRPAIPDVKNRAWCSSPIDRFILAGLEKRGITPNPRADKRTLIRRAYFDLIGLPPTAAQIDAYLADNSPKAFETVIDGLLASPRYGERWGRHWLDVARYADTRGYVFTEDRVYHNAYTYRDYVIRAFNEDLPYDRFIKEQLAADKLELGDDHRPLAGMGFLTVGRRFLNNPHDIIDDRIDVTMRGFQGLTVTCARCHDHKFDPIPTKDYYSLYGVFASSQEPNPPPGISPKAITAPYEEHNKKLMDAEKQSTNIVRAQINVLRDKIKTEPNKVPAPVKDILQKIRIRELPNEAQLAKLVSEFVPEAQANLKTLKETAESLKKTMPTTPEFAMSMSDLPSVVNPHVFKRGNPNNPGDEVPRRFVQIIDRSGRKTFPNGSGRLDLAAAIADKENPLTARVIVNRVWLYHFGAGLVRTPSDFGTRGDPPTHPELLDWLASEFTNPTPNTQHPIPWSLKRLHKLIMLSSAYQQSSAVDLKRFDADPENRLISRMNRQRLDLEAMRDSLLYVAGRLDTTLGGKSVEITTQPYSTRRTVYGFIERQNLQGMYRTFDLASPDAHSPQRYRTTIPQQALFMMNSPFTVEQAKYLARRPEVQAVKDDTQRIKLLYRIALGRQPESDELSDGLAFVRRPSNQTALAATSPDPDKLDAWDEYAQVLLMTNEFCFVD